MKLILKDKSEITINNFSEYSNITKDVNQLEGILMTILNPSDSVTISSLEEQLTEDNLSAFTVERSDGVKTDIDGTHYELYDIRKVMNEIVYNIEIVLRRC